MSLGSCDLLLPPAPSSPTLISSAQETSEEFDDERRERWREERQCNCCEKDPNCRHFLTYDLFEVCLALREVYAKRKCLLPQERKSLCFTASYHDWFIPPFAAWLAIVSEQVPLQILIYGRNMSSQCASYSLVTPARSESRRMREAGNKHPSWGLEALDFLS